MKRYGRLRSSALSATGRRHNSADGNFDHRVRWCQARSAGEAALGFRPAAARDAKAKAEVAFVPAETYEEFHTRAVAAGKRIAATPDGPAYLDGIGKNYGSA